MNMTISDFLLIVLLVVFSYCLGTYVTYKIMKDPTAIQGLLSEQSYLTIEGYRVGSLDTQQIIPMKPTETEVLEQARMYGFDLTRPYCLTTKTQRLCKN